VAAVVVSYNAADHLARCLEGLAANGVGRVVVVDNGSTDGSEAAAREAGAVWSSTGSNLGYGGAANQGAASDPAVALPYLLVCNPDVDLGPESVARLARALEADPEVGLVGPKLLNPDGSVYPSVRTFPDLVSAIGHGLLGLVAPDNPFTRRYQLLDWDHSRAARVDWVSGACFLARREAWADVGGFDPTYFMYMEDVDLCWRMSRAGWSVAYAPEAEVTHVQGVSTNRHPYRMLAAHHRSMWRFAWRTTTGRRRAALPIVAVGLAGRLGVAMLQRGVQAQRHTPPARPRVAPDAGGDGGDGDGPYRRGDAGPGVRTVATTGGMRPRPLP
jgi:N-acetylglucosaminyl-diphospho-decaprenol L-rhamnosyltransferase